ncbi:MAG: hypothetical protein M3R25_04735, partial [Bacteroidota bacterium]|nr:hypothetical protein [Bacteroidota bacterium]
MKIEYTLLTAILLLSLVSCELDSEGINQIEAILETDPFDEIRLESSSNVRIIQADEYKVVLK